MRLSKAQQEALAKLTENDWKSAYELQVRLSTLFALEQKGFVERKTDKIVWFGWERTGMLWRRRGAE